MRNFTKFILTAAVAGLAICGCSVKGLRNIQKDSAVVKQDVPYIGLSCLEMKPDSAAILKNFKKMQAEGEKDGYVPLIILRDERILDEKLDWEREEAGSYEKAAKKYLETYKNINTEDYFGQLRGQYEEKNMFDFSWVEELKNDPEFSDLDLDMSEPPEKQAAISLGFDTTNIYIARIPVDSSYETLAYVPMGGVNDCPATDELMAAAKKWQEEYGAVLLAAGYDTLQFYVENPPEDEETTAKLAEEMYLLCYDIIGQGTYTLENLAKSIQGAHFWYFWWD